MEDFEETDVLLLMGSNTTEAHPIIANRMKKGAKKGVKIIVVDPRKIDMVKVADSHLQLKVGTDIALINAMIHVILKEELYDAGYISRTTLGLEKLAKQVERYTPAFAAGITGLPEEQIIETARAFAAAENGMIAYTLGITEHHCGVNNVLSIANLALLTGHIGKRGNGIMPLRGQNNVQGAGDMGGLPNFLTGAQPVTDPEVRRRFEKEWGVNLPEFVGRNQTQMIEKMENGDMKALYIVGENPIMADVNMNHTKKAFENLDFLVVQDIFLTETAKLADVVLPARSWGEVEGTYTNTDRRIQRVRKAVDAPGNALDDWKILTLVSEKMGYSMNYEHPSEIWEEVRRVAPHLYGGMPYERLDKENGLQYPCPHEEHPGTAIMHERFHAEMFEGPKGPFTPLDFTPPLEQPDKEYPFTLTTGRRYESYNTHTQTKHYASGVKIKQTEETADIHPDDADKLGLQDGDMVTVRSRRGKVDVKVKVTEQVSPGLVFMSFHFAETPTNKLTLNEYDPISGTAEYKACAVSVTKMN